MAEKFHTYEAFLTFSLVKLFIKNFVFFKEKYCTFLCMHKSHAIHNSKPLLKELILNTLFEIISNT